MSPLAWSVLLLAAAPAAQEPVWRLPARGAAEYRRESSAESATAATRRAAEALAVKGAVPAEYLAHLAPAPVLCEGELDVARRTLRDPVRELRDLPRQLAFDLALPAATRIRVPRVLPFGDLVLTGKVAPADAAGRQEFTLDVATADPETLPGETKAEVQRFVRPLCKYAAAGRLTIARTYDAAKGVVREFTATLSLVCEERKGQWRRLEFRDHWTLTAVHDNQDAAFRAAVAAAIRSGAAYVRKQLTAFGKNYMDDARKEQRSYGSGRIALGLLTLLHAETKADDPVVAGAFAELARRELIDTYTLGIALMAMAAKYAPPGEVEMLRSGVLEAPAPRHLSAPDKALAQQWLDRLRTNIDTRVDEAYRLRFNYVAGPRWDNSVNQYGLLGLYAAEMCQLVVPVTCWRAAANHLLEVQDQDQQTLRLELLTHKELRDGEDAGSRTRAAAPKVPTRGFTYYAANVPSYGSMTTAGLTGLQLARAGLMHHHLEKADILPKVDEALQAGFAWLAANFHVRSNPGFIGRADANWYYYLYGLERACELSSVARVQGRDWYFEGAMQLLGRQRKNGSFPADSVDGYAIEATCFAVLFLKKATLPATTGG